MQLSDIIIHSGCPAPAPPKTSLEGQSSKWYPGSFAGGQPKGIISVLLDLENSDL